MRRHIIVAVTVLLAVVCAVPADDAAKKDQAQLEGTWIMVSREIMGMKASADELKKVNGKLVVKGDKIAFWTADKVLSEDTFKIDAAAKPRTLDLKGVTGVTKGLTSLAIYELSGDSLKVCFSLPDGRRPTEFTSPADKEWILAAYKREKK